MIILSILFRGVASPSIQSAWPVQKHFFKEKKGSGAGFLYFQNKFGGFFLNPTEGYYETFWDGCRLSLAWTPWTIDVDLVNSESPQKRRV